MIKLTLNPDTDPKVYTLGQPLIIIGRAGADPVDIPLPLANAEPRHVTIEEQNDRFVVCNAANDPFTSINGIPFGKKSLKNFDQIEIDTCKIQFEFIEEGQTLPPISNAENDTAIDIDHLLKEVENLSPPIKEPEPDNARSNGKQDDAESGTDPADLEAKENEEDEDANEDKTSKKYYLRDFDDESDLWSEEEAHQQSFTLEPKRNAADAWKILAGLLFAVIALSAVICSGVYFRVSGKNSQEEKKIAAGIADIAMAMTHAKLNHITPNKQNWADPNFIRNNLAYVLAHNLHTQAQIDSEGQFTRYPYRLRVYTSRSTDHFIVIAQPAPNHMQWLVHKKTIVVDSSTMEMRKITNLKAINRLLANPDPLEGSNGEEIYALIKGGTLMSLNSLAGHKNHWGFSPPKALAFIRQGAENYIYNAPRYYPFSENILRKAVQFYQNPEASNDLALIEDEIEGIANFKDIVLYTSEGLQTAIEAQKALNILSSNNHFLIAYVNFNSKGFMASSHLLMNEERGNIAFLDPLEIMPASFELKGKEDAFGQDIGDAVSVAEKFLSDRDQGKSGDGKKKSQGKGSSFIPKQQLLEEESDEESSEAVFDHPLYEKLKDIHSKFQREIRAELYKLFREYPDLPQETFIQYTNQARLAPFADLGSLEDLGIFREQADLGKPGFDQEHQERLQLEAQEFSQDEAERKLQSISEARSLPELQQRIEDFSLLSSKNSSNAERAASCILDGLAFLLLSPKSPYSSTAPGEEDRNALMWILKNIQINDPGVPDYFINEFKKVQAGHAEPPFSPA